MIATVEFDFDAPESDWQLALDAGDEVEVLEKPHPGWWTVSATTGRNAGKVGDVPAAFLLLVADDEEVEEGGDDEGGEGGA